MSRQPDAAPAQLWPRGQVATVDEARAGTSIGRCQIPITRAHFCSHRTVAPAANGPTLMHCLGLRTRDSPVSVLSHWTTSTSDGRMSANTSIAGWMQKARFDYRGQTCFRTATRTSTD